MGSRSRAIVEPVHPFERGVLDSVHAPPGAAPVDDLGLVETVDRFGQGIVVAIADAAHGGFKAGLGEALGIFDRDVLGEFKRSSQHLDEGGCDEHSKAAFGSIWAGAIVVTRSTAGGRTR